MEIFQIEFTMIIVICLSKTAISEEFKVFRTRPDGEDGWTDGRDSFIIPPSQCTSVHSTHCWRFRADSSSPSQGQCSCSCRYGSATFMFHNSKWECSNNDDVRRVLGNRQPQFITFDGEPSASPLRMVNNSDYQRITLQRYLHDCKVDTATSRSIGCYGPGVPFRNKPPFEIVLGVDTTTDFPYFLKVSTLGVPNTDEYKGRIIKLGIMCSSNIFSWLLFKYVGNFNCSSTAPTFPPPHTLKSLPSKQPNGGIVSVSNVSEIGPTVPEVPPTASVLPPIPGRERDTHHSPSVGFIAALIASALLLMIVVGFSFLGHHHSNKKPQPSPKTAVRENAEATSQRASSAYEADDENGYIALDIRELPIYASKYQAPNHDNAKHSAKVRRAPPSRPGEHNMHGHASAKVSVCRDPDLDTEESVYRDPDLDTGLRNKNSGPIRVQQLEYNYLEELSVEGKIGPCQNGKNGTQGHVLNKRNLDRSPRPSQFGAIHNKHSNQSANVSVYRDPDLDTEEAVYKDPDLDTGLRDKKSGPIRVEQLEYNYLEELSVAGVMGPGRNDKDGTQGHVLSKRYLDCSPRPSQYGAMSRDGHVLSKRYFDRSAGPSQYGTMSKDGDVLDERHLDHSVRPSQYGAESSDKNVYNYTLEKYLPQVGNQLTDSEAMNEQVYNVLEEEEEEPPLDDPVYDDVYGTKNLRDPE